MSIHDEAERCALLCETRANMAMATASLARKNGELRQIVELHDLVAEAFRVAARGCREGWDPRVLHSDTVPFVRDSDMVPYAAVR
jgi:hypothetical protein